MFAGASAIAAASASSAFPHPCSRSSHAGSAAPRIGMPAAACRAAVQSFPDAACAVERPRVPASLYHVLRVRRDASPVEIKSAYRALAKMYHPDAAESDGRDFMEIHNAYATLSDPASRSLYDLSLGCGFARGRLSSSSSRGSGDRWSGFYSTRRWETDQCW